MTPEIDHEKLKGYLMQQNIVLPGDIDGGGYARLVVYYTQMFLEGDIAYTSRIADFLRQAEVIIEDDEN